MRSCNLLFCGLCSLEKSILLGGLQQSNLVTNTKYYNVPCGYTRIPEARLLTCWRIVILLFSPMQACTHSARLVCGSQESTKFTKICFEGYIYDVHTRILDPSTNSTLILSLAFLSASTLRSQLLQQIHFGGKYSCLSHDPTLNTFSYLIHNSLLQVVSLSSSRSYCQMPLSLPPSPLCTSQPKETSDIGGTIMEWLARTILTRFPFRLAVVLPWSLGSQRSSEALSLCSNKCHSLLDLF